MSEHATKWILIVDDDAASIKIMARALAPDFATESALSGPEALARLATGDLPTLILLDVMMPDMDGFEVCRQLKAEPRTRDIPVIFITANHHLESELNALLTGASDFIHKPINPQVMSQRVQLHIQLREREQALSQLNEEIKQLSYYDTLTGLPNRRLLIDRLHNRLLLIDRIQKNLSNGVHHQEVGALMYIDLDNFQTFNDTFGQDIGDQLLQQVARRLTACARKTDTVARFYEDEFVVVLEGLTEPMEVAAVQAKTIAQRFLATLRQPYRVADADHHCTASIGIIMISNHYTSVEDLLIKASLATEQAKMSGRNSLCFIDPEI